MFDFKKAVEEVNNGASRRKFVSAGTLMSLYPKGVHVNSIARSSYNDEPLFIYTFDEDDTKCFSSTSVLRDKTEQLLHKCNNDIDEFNNALASQWRLHVTFLPKETGKKYFPVILAPVLVDGNSEIIDEETGEVLQKASKTSAKPALPF